MKVCVTTKSKNMILIVDKIELGEGNAVAKLIVNNTTIGDIYLTDCELKKLDRTDGNMEYYEIIEKENL